MSLPISSQVPRKMRCVVQSPQRISPICQGVEYLTWTPFGVVWLDRNRRETVRTNSQGDLDRATIQKFPESCEMTIASDAYVEETPAGFGKDDRTTLLLRVSLRESRDGSCQSAFLALDCDTGTASVVIYVAPKGYGHVRFSPNRTRFAAFLEGRVVRGDYDFRQRAFCCDPGVLTVEDRIEKCVVDNEGNVQLWSSANFGCVWGRQTCVKVPKMWELEMDWPLREKDGRTYYILWRLRWYGIQEWEWNDLIEGAKEVPPRRDCVVRTPSKELWMYDRCRKIGLATTRNWPNVVAPSIVAFRSKAVLQGLGETNMDALLCPLESSTDSLENLILSRMADDAPLTLRGPPDSWKRILPDQRAYLVACGFWDVRLRRGLFETLLDNPQFVHLANL